MFNTNLIESESGFYKNRLLNGLKTTSWLQRRWQTVKICIVNYRSIRIGQILALNFLYWKTLLRCNGFSKNYLGYFVNRSYNAAILGKISELQINTFLVYTMLEKEQKTVFHPRDPYQALHRRKRNHLRATIGIINDRLGKQAA